LFVHELQFLLNVVAHDESHHATAAEGPAASRSTKTAATAETAPTARLSVKNTWRDQGNVNERRNPNSKPVMSHGTNLPAFPRSSEWLDCRRRAVKIATGCSQALVS
jgi:hypothetical protein